MILLEKNLPDPTDSGHDQWLRQEIIESQKTQADFLKWKLISVVAVASVSMAFTSVRLLICLVPMICVVVDLISIQIMIRIHTIGTYLKTNGNTYEEYVFLAKARAFESVASYGSSLLFNGTTGVLGLFLPQAQGQFTGYLNAFVIAGILGIMATLFLCRIHLDRLKEVIRSAERFRQIQNASMAASQ